MQTADVLADDAFLDLFNRAYADYFVPLRLDREALRTMVEVSDLDLASSSLVDLDGAPVGFALLGVRGREGWIGGMGVVPEARRRGLGRALMEAAIAAARRRGVHRLRLEVLEQNEPAVQLYRQLGFAHERELEVWSLAGGSGGSAPVDEAVVVEVDDAHAWVVAHRSSPEPWQRADETLVHLRRRDPPPAALELRRDGERAGAAVYTAGQVIQLATTSNDPETTARRMIEAIRARTGGVRWLNAPAGEPGSAAMEALGATRVARQHELVLALGP